MVVQCTGNCDPCWHAQAFNTQTLQRFDFYHKYSKIYCEIMSTLCKIMWNLQKSQTRSEILQPIPSVVCRLPWYVFCTWVDLADQLFISSSLFIHCNVLILLHNALRKSSWHNREEIIYDARGSILEMRIIGPTSHISKANVFHSRYFTARWRRPLQMSVL